LHGGLSPEIEKVRERLGDRLRYVYRHFPLTQIHPHATHAAEAAEAVGAQGAFWAMHDRLYDHPEALSDEELVSHAAALGLDTDRFAADLAESEHESRVRENFESGDLANVPLTVTPRGGGSDALREPIDRSERGAPAAGLAVRDRFSADEIFQRVVATANEEFSRSNRLLFLSGPAAGIVMNFSFLGSAALTALVSDGGGPPRTRRPRSATCCTRSVSSASCSGATNCSPRTPSRP
jgi:hypothetical protein